ncbi:lytic transglycosylase domain-containing protein [Polyangium jinanense]|uniref:Transglycosylase SLT domain-containing protein n=1 Tax=Polyangium jinanense TaxID=2829994 RepID=A0A9X4AUR9_9BACT|nr:lytic transglycosylase domain-containing protein [Polyangium jinanense]MDC3956522.1 transglycosylase SLT domain-containing protein [Polyangium jinanense]MDC3985553.1 transglycosylase SLT domain-containing protein [Polyangium jinanense]
MSLLHRIPPLVSALAFGYGVGMSAPDAALAPVQAAVVAVAPAPGAARPEAAPVPLIVDPSRTPVRGDAPRGGVTAARMGGPESQQLGRLREVEMREAARGEQSSLDRPMYSRSPRLNSDATGEGAEVDDLDVAGAEALSRLQLPDLKVSITRRTLKYVRFFTRTDRGRGMFETWLKRSGRFQDLIQGELREWRLPEDLIWVAMIESGFDARAKSPAGAMGLWQFMPATGAVYGLEQNKHVDQRKNPKLASRAAAHHLRDLYMRFGNWDLALAAYNMGYEQLLDRIDRYGTADFNELARQEALPTETSSYVPKIAAAALVANNLERFGFDQVELARPVDAAEIAAPPGLSLKTLAKAAGVPLKTVRQLNPDLLGDRLPPGRGDFLVNVPAESLSRAHTMLPVLLQTEPIVTEDAAVLDPVDLIGGRDFVRRRAATRDNDSLLSLLPSYKKRRALRDPVEELAAQAGVGPEADDDEGDEEPFRPRKKRTGRKTLLYKVGPGDTLIGIARQFAMDVDDVARENRLGEEDKLRAGSILRLHVKPGVLGALDLGAAEGGEAGAKAEETQRRIIDPGTSANASTSKDKDKGPSDAARGTEKTEAQKGRSEGRKGSRGRSRG